MGDDFVEQQHRRESRHLGDQASACARTRPISSAFCSPVEASRSGDALVRVDHLEIGQMRTVEWSGRRRRRGRDCRVARRDSAPRSRRPDASGISFSIQPSSAISAGGNARSPCGSPARASSRRTVSTRCPATATASSAVSCSTASSQCGIGPRLLEQPVARAQRAFQRIDPAAMLGIDRERQAVEKAPALGRGADKQRIHGRHQPDHAQMIGEGRGRADRLAVDPAFA